MTSFARDLAARRCSPARSRRFTAAAPSCRCSTPPRRRNGARGATCRGSRILGTGFPPFRGGPCRWADREGLGEIVATLERFAEQLHERFAPSDALRGFADRGGFYGGWITSKVVGPFKGGPETSGW